MSIDEIRKDVVSIYATECLEQPDRLAGLIQSYATDSEIRAQMSRLKSAMQAGGAVPWLGMGASYCSALAGAYWLTLLGRASWYAEASEWLHFAAGTRNQSAEPILVTTSGESAELVEICREYAPSGNLICNSPGSTSWQRAQVRLPILAGEERANATKTYVNSTAASLIAASEIAGREWRADADRALEGFASTLTQIFGRRCELEEFCRSAVDIEFVGRGPSLAAAQMGALGFREMTAMRSCAHSGGAFRHGPLLDVGPGHVAIILALGSTANLGARLARACIERGGKVMLVGADDYESFPALMPVKLRPVPEPWESLTGVLVPQALTLAYIERLGSHYVRTTTTTE